MKKFKILEHKADLKIQVFGKTKKELFENAMLAMFEAARYESEAEERKRKIKVSSFNLNSLLVDFLGEVLYLSETKKEFYQKIDFKKLTNKDLEGILIGKKLKRSDVIIKGVTYHDLEIHQKRDGSWEATILFDI